MNRTLVVALTGGIGSGKSTIANHFAELGVPVIDADLLAREQTRAGMPALKEIAQIFGTHMLTPAGELDRAALRRYIFDEPGARERLEAILHPKIRTAMRDQLRTQVAPYVVLVIPLLLETGQTDLADRILAVDLPENLQLKRAARRDLQTPEQIQAIMRAQCPRADRLAVADDVIDNRGPLDQLQRRIEALHKRYMYLYYNA